MFIDKTKSISSHLLKGIPEFYISEHYDRSSFGDYKRISIRSNELETIGCWIFKRKIPKIVRAIEIINERAINVVEWGQLDIINTEVERFEMTTNKSIVLSKVNSLTQFHSMC